jgi:2,5-diketo-D-gluconate reductase A
VRSVSARHARTPAQVLLAWSIQRGAVPLPKANRRDHLVENLEALDFELSAEDFDVLNSLNEEYSSLGSLPYV